MTTSLTTFFRSLPVVDQREPRAELDKLEQRLPRRGGALDPDWARLQRQQDTRLAQGGHTNPRSLLCGAEIQRAEALFARREQCAELIQVHMLRYLYRPDGPMCRRGARELWVVGEGPSSDC